MDKNTLIKVVNREDSFVGYKVPELGVTRQFAPREQKEITFEELEKLSFLPGGLVLLKDYLVIRSESAAKELLPNVEPEYFYGPADVKRILTTATMEEFLDCLDFAPEGVLELIKDMAVNLPVESVKKREAILKKLSFNVDKAIEIKNTKFDGDEENAEAEEKKTPVRRVAAAATTTTTRRASAPKVTTTE